jgi:hypothetical protein
LDGTPTTQGKPHNQKNTNNNQTKLGQTRKPQETSISGTMWLLHSWLQALGTFSFGAGLSPALLVFSMFSCAFVVFLMLLQGFASHR